jgi:translocation and assembly module TamB
MKRVFHFSAKAIKVIVLTVFVLFIAVAIFLNTNYFDSFIKKQIEQRLGKAINRKVTVDSVSFNPFFLDIELKNFVIGGDAKSPNVDFFQARTIYANFEWRNAIRKKVRLSEVLLDKPEIHVIFHKDGGSNWPTTAPRKDKKKRGLDLIISKVDCDNMTVIVDQQRIPLKFSVTDLETYVEYDYKAHNYAATTSFRNGFLKIQNFETFRFDLKSEYRIISDRVAFERLFILSNRSKFYFAGDMYNLKDPFFDFHFHSRINIDQAKQMFRLGPEMSGAGNFRGIYKGTFARFRLQGHGDFKNFIFYSLPIDSANFDLDMTDNWLNVNNIRASMFDGSYTGTFAIAPLKGISIYNADAKFQNWDGKRLGDFIRMKDMILPVKGSGTAKIRWDEKGGVKNGNGNIAFKLEPYTTATSDLAATADATHFDNSLYSQPFVLAARNETSLRLEGGQLRNIQSVLETPYTRSEIQGSIDLSGKADLSVHTNTEKISEIDLLFHHLQSYFGEKPARLQEFWGVSGKAEFEGRLDQTVWSPFKPRITGNVHGRDTTFHGVHLDDVYADIQFYDRLIEIFDSHMKTDKATGQSKAKFFLADKKAGIDDALELEGTVKNFPAREIASAFYMTLPIQTDVDASILIKGPFNAIEGSADFQTKSGTFYGENWDRVSGKVIFFPDSLGLRDITVWLDGGHATASGDLVFGSYDYNVEFSGEKIPIEKLAILKHSGIEMSGVGSGSGNGKGTITRPELSGVFSFQALKYRGELYGDVESKIELKDSRLAVEAEGTTRGIRSYAKAELRLDGDLPFNADLDIRKFPLEIITKAYMPDVKGLAGLLGGKFEMSGRLKLPSVDHLAGSLDSIQIEFAGLRFKEARPLQVTLSDQAIEVKDSLLYGPHSSIELTGKIYPKQQWKLDLNLSSKVDLQILSEFDKEITASGLSTARIAINGTLEEPALTGALEISNGFFRHFSFPNSLTEISALVSFKNKNITLQSLQANSSGGTLTAGGSAILKGYGFQTYRFDLYAQKIRIHFPEGLRSTVTAELHLQNQGNASYMVGDIDVVQGVYLRTFEETPTLFSYARVPTFAGLPGAVAARNPTQLNIHIHSDEGLQVRNNFANIVSSADLNLIGSLDNPVLVGRLDVKKGTITFRNREYKVTRGSIDFQNPYRTEAQMTFVAETHIREYNITLTFNGTFDRIYHQISSDPPLPTDDIYALLGGGYIGNSVQDTAALIVGQQISDFIASPITSPLEREFKRVFGLQRFSIDPVYVQHGTQQDAAARITLAKDISSDFSVTYSTNVFTVAEEIILLQYHLTDEIQVTAYKDERPRYGIDFLVTKTFE